MDKKREIELQNLIRLLEIKSEQEKSKRLVLVLFILISIAFVLLYYNNTPSTISDFLECIANAVFFGGAALIVDVFLNAFIWSKSWQENIYIEKLKTELRILRNEEYDNLDDFYNYF